MESYLSNFLMDEYNKKAITNFLIETYNFSKKRCIVFLDRLKGDSIDKTSKRLGIKPKTVKYYTYEINLSLGTDRVAKWIYYLPFESISLKKKITLIDKANFAFNTRKKIPVLSVGLQNGVT